MNSHFFSMKKSDFPSEKYFRGALRGDGGTSPPAARHYSSGNL